MSILQELLSISKLMEAPEQPGKELKNEPAIGHEGTNPKDKDPSQNEPDAHNQNSKEILTKLFATADEANTLAVYIRNDAFDIRQAKPDEELHISWPGEMSKTIHAEEGQYVVKKPEQSNKQKLIDSKDFEEKYELVNPSEKPDAEGFASYRLKDEILAFQYNENETLDINVSGHTIKIEPEDYVGHKANDAKKLIVMSKTDFEKKYRLS